MKTRIITGVTVAALVLLLVFYAPVSILVSVTLLITAIGYIEFDRLFFQTKSLPRQIGMLWLVFLLVISLRQDASIGLLFLFFGFAAIAICQLLTMPKDAPLDKVVHSLAVNLLGLVYVSSLTGFLLPIVEISDTGRQWLLLLFFMVFLGDTAAYFIGSKFGKHRLMERISPKKSVEGAAASVAMSLIIALIWILFFMEDGFSNTSAWKLLLFTPVLSVLAQLGDLFESLLKRSVAVKDSGSFLPGHGGILDRIDGLCFAAPAFYVFLKCVMENP